MRIGVGKKSSGRAIDEFSYESYFASLHELRTYIVEIAVDLKITLERTRILEACCPIRANGAIALLVIEGHEECYRLHFLTPLGQYQIFEPISKEKNQILLDKLMPMLRVNLSFQSSVRKAFPRNKNNMQVYRFSTNCQGGSLPEPILELEQNIISNLFKTLTRRDSRKLSKRAHSRLEFSRARSNSRLSVKPPASRPRRRVTFSGVPAMDYTLFELGEAARRSQTTHKRSRTVPCEEVIDGSSEISSANFLKSTVIVRNAGRSYASDSEDSSNLSEYDSSVITSDSELAEVEVEAEVEVKGKNSQVVVAR